LRHAKTALSTIFAACLLAIYLISAVRLDRASAGVVSSSPSFPASPTSPTSQSSDPRDFQSTGQAVYYGAELAGNPTASGEIFDPALLTAAHRTLPLGSNIQVTNLANGLRTVVRINDRGPFTEDSIIDLSTAAAQRIGLLPRGSGQVRLERVP
jgi:rare lipoprotein A